MTVKQFWSLVIIGGPDDCWNFTGFLNWTGYGQFHIGKGKNRSSERAHRFAWKITRGKIPKGKCVLHRCDNRSCVNPNHLWIGTQLDNVRDMAAKGRRVNQIGSKHGMSKLDETTVERLRIDHSKGQTSYRKIAKQYRLAVRTVAAMILGLTWKHVPMP